MKQLVSTDWLEKNIDKVKIFDASWHLPNSNRKAEEEYKLNHINKSIFFDIDKYSNQNSSLPHMFLIKMNGKRLFLVLELKILIILLFMTTQMYLVHVEFGTLLFTLGMILI